MLLYSLFATHFHLLFFNNKHFHYIICLLNFLAEIDFSRNPALMYFPLEPKRFSCCDLLVRFKLLFFTHPPEVSVLMSQSYRDHGL